MRKYFLIIPLIIFFFAASNVAAEQVYLNDDVGIQTTIKIETNDRFIWRGYVAKTGTGDFGVLHQTIAIPQDLEESLKKDGILEINNTIQVAGINQNGIKIAQEIKLISLPHASDKNSLDDLLNSIKDLF
ncbi:hypothetical protein A2334_03480 [Candidatus Roizmanbacteria bacterium RIFOXYB2_FULL_38_10]|uniref:DUF5666 domain-containing protein n=1 Tax=Candidatus Roizmanbacteria bacterium RIFOXYD1_FULL_38_12 TaxID=1802093 RepID=A0A1F7L0Y8_9BACT|nr:MAG: hypothetical protein A3K47_03365 [Candidatus Roizmanbacteria bacterium RIFOXYA2_FULL_38_14]OGK63802.1 MAG: hypothetical protein A3K27_03365 [Candidatus Roizmanbacteria bacterium RIFOXYA1_FULL_37_12]OGK65648.1 MAG: hypothetical protein A3K38_03365 [Candidatus Roizmanbacteria bacterium RIFOXYB1_FULL_40_23]OGK67464.1 MAG: hypothetical protein A2334_03480 [Candidatus Roizmanbacteria bacterium RIFOXYB2_FULL_38_10]OGK70053.1 MAG: hypothetical protein A3K21_03370 [Candidatus Roizmanbacteria ba